MAEYLVKPAVSETEEGFQGQDKDNMGEWTACLVLFEIQKKIRSKLVHLLRLH